MHCALVFLFTYRIFKKKITSSFGENNIMNTKPCMSSHNKKIILIYTKDCSDTERYKNQAIFVPQFRPNFVDNLLIHPLILPQYDLLTNTELREVSAKCVKTGS